MIQKKLLLIFLFILLINSVFAVSPVLQQSQIGTLDIEYLPIFVFKTNSNISLHFHVTNATGFLKDNTTTSCNLHLYNSTGNHIDRKNLTYDDGDFEYKINDTFITKEGEYSYIINCQNDKYGGYQAVKITFTKDGLEPIEYNLLSLVISQLVLILFYFGCGYINFKQGKKDMNKVSFWIGFVSFAMAIMEMMLLITFIHGTFFNIYIKNFLDLNLIINLIMMFGLSVLTYTRIAFNKINFADDDGDIWE